GPPPERQHTCLRAFAQKIGNLPGQAHQGVWLPSPRARADRHIRAAADALAGRSACGLTGAATPGAPDSLAEGAPADARAVESRPMSQLFRRKPIAALLVDEA